MYISVYHSTSQYITVYLSILQLISVYHSTSQYISVYYCILQHLTCQEVEQLRTKVQSLEEELGQETRRREEVKWSSEPGCIVAQRSKGFHFFIFHRQSCRRRRKMLSYLKPLEDWENMKE